MLLNGENSKPDYNIIIHKKDDVYLQIECERSTAKELNEYFAFDVPDAKFMPSYKNRLWDGKIRLFDIRNNQIYVGLSSYIYKFANAKRYTITGGITNLKSTVTARDYQIDAIKFAIKTGRCILVSPTASGKSFIIYALIRYFQQTIDKHILLLVPRSSLVEQMYKDFADYGWDSEQFCHKIYGGQLKDSSKLVYISTWQSLYKQPKKYFDRFQVIVGLFGSVKKVTTTRQLIDKKQISNLKIVGIVLTYSKKDSIIRTYHKEIKFITEHPLRNNLISNLSVDLKGNTLVLFTLIKHGELLYNLIKQKTSSVNLIYGKTDTQSREDVRKLAEETTGNIIVASFGVFSTGINIKNLHNIIFASPYKSRIRNLQSIGRGLRAHESKEDGAKLYDIADDFNNRNHTIKHFVKRIEIYNQEQFDYEICKVTLTS